MENPKVAYVLSLISFLDRQRIPQSLLDSEDEHLDELEEAVGALEAFSLVVANTKDRCYDIHRLV